MARRSMSLARTQPKWRLHGSGARWSGIPTAPATHGDCTYGRCQAKTSAGAPPVRTIISSNLGQKVPLGPACASDLVSQVNFPQFVTGLIEGVSLWFVLM